jgi:hypothetical protein
MSITFKTTINCEDVEITYDYDKGYPGTYYQPSEPPSVEIVSIMFKGVDVAPLFEDFEKLESECMENAAEQAKDAAEAEADYRYEQEKDRRLGL